MEENPSIAKNLVGAESISARGFDWADIEICPIKML